MPKVEKLKKVEEIVEILDLQKCLNTKIGNTIERGLSGGEKKRANIGCELITNPYLIFLDEPTSGLDSSNAFNLVKTLQTFAVNNLKTVVMTIHQPSSQIFYLFDKLLLMVNGKVAYYGKASKVLDFFEGAGFHCEEHFNPADYVLEVLSRGGEVEEKIVTAFQEWEKGTLPVRVEKNNTISGSGEQGSNPAVLPMDYGLQNPAGVWEESDNVSLDSNHISIEMEKKADSTGTHQGEVDLDHGDKWPTSFWTQFYVLSHRTFKQSIPVILSKLVLVQNMLLAFFIGLLWFQVPHKEESINDRRGLLFFFTVYWSLNPMFRALLTFPSEEVIIRKERAAGTYRLSAYFFGKCISEVPLVVFQPILFLVIFYWLCGLNPSVAFLGQALNLVFSTVLSQSLGLAIGASVMSFDKAIVVASVLVLSVMLLGGFYIQHVPFWLNWMQLLSFITYSFENCLIMEFTGIKDHSCGEVKTSFLSCKNNGTTITGEEILTYLGVKRTFGENLAILVLFTVVFRIIAYCALRFFHRPE